MAKFDFGIVVTGGIGSGKSTVANLLKLYGFAIVDADEISHEILDKSAGEVVKVFGEEALGEGGKIERKKLGEIVFSGENAKENRVKLEAILHPKIHAEIYERAFKFERLRVPYFVDIPLFFERGNYEFDTVLTVYAPENTLIERIMKRNSIGKKAALARLQAQMPIEKKRSLATYVIENTGDLRTLTAKVEDFVRIIKEKYATL